MDAAFTLLTATHQPSANAMLPKILAIAVHILTASGAALGFMALLSATHGDFATMFAWLAVALLVDGIDGPLARAFDAAAKAPRWSGDTLDLVVDFITYVFVPAYAIATAGLMPPALGVVAALIIVVTSALYFADRGMKMEGHWFRGFPAVWNGVAFYLILLTPPAAVCAVAIVALAALTFAPIPFVHPIRVKQARWLTVILIAAWFCLAIVAIVAGMRPPAPIAASLCAIGFYFIAAGLMRRA